MTSASLRSAPMRSGSGALAHPLPPGMRDLLPEEAEIQGRLLSRAVSSFELHGYQRVTLPAFEYAEVLERGLGAIEPSSILRFVEPDTGEVVALRPDVTPQVARLIATRLADHPVPMRLAYRGSVLRRQHERARHEQQILQAGIELVGQSGFVADLEIVRVTIAAVREAGLDDFVVDLGHGGIAHALLASLPVEERAPLIESLSQKDGAELERRARAVGLEDGARRALLELLTLQGGLEVFARAQTVLQGTAALELVVGLEELARATAALVGEGRLVIDLGETRTVAYYTGMMFQVLAEGPGQAVASGGRYDALYERFGMSRPAAGAALHIDHLRWAVGDSAENPRPRALVLGALGQEGVDRALNELRKEGISAAPFALDAGVDAALDYALAWRYSHVVEPLAGSAEVDLKAVATGQLVAKGVSSVTEAVKKIRA